MQVLKVVADGLTTSFRYPHFMQEVQPTFEMPPPATIYGHICSALGEWFDPAGTQFALHFSFEARFDDMEHVHLVSPATGKLPGTSMDKALGGGIMPFTRGLLFRPHLVLYVNRPEWLPHFCSPRYAVSLGRSQDLFTYSSIEIVQLERAANAYMEHTLAPYSFARRLGQGVVVLMPRFVDPWHNRRPSFGRYVVLHRRVHCRDLLRFSNDPEIELWTDPSAPIIDGDRLGLAFHTWIGDDESALRLS